MRALWAFIKGTCRECWRSSLLAVCCGRCTKDWNDIYINCGINKYWQIGLCDQDSSPASEHPPVLFLLFVDHLDVEGVVKDQLLQLFFQSDDHFEGDHRDFVVVPVELARIVVNPVNVEYYLFERPVVPVDHSCYFQNTFSWSGLSLSRTPPPANSQGSPPNSLVSQSSTRIRPGVCLLY